MPGREDRLAACVEFGDANVRSIFRAAQRHQQDRGINKPRTVAPQLSRAVIIIQSVKFVMSPLIGQHSN